jgi:hypothetical protein
MMTRIRRKRQRNVGFEALEGRLVLSTGMSAASPHIHDAIVRASQRTVRASFKGRVAINGSTLTTRNLNGHIGPDHFRGYGTGTEVNNQFQGGTVYLSNNKGTIELGLSPLYSIKVGKATTKTFSITVLSATGQYAPYVIATGTVTRWNVPARPNAVATISGFFTV